jgi:hypothetical protein
MALRAAPGTGAAGNDYIIALSAGRGAAVLLVAGGRAGRWLRDRVSRFEVAL